MTKAKSKPIKNEVASIHGEGSNLGGLTINHLAEAVFGSLAEVMKFASDFEELNAGGGS